MHIKNEILWQKITEKTYELNIKMGISIFPKNDKNGNLINLGSNIEFFDNQENYFKWLDDLPENSKILDENILTSSKYPVFRSSTVNIISVTFNRYKRINFFFIAKTL
jgi:hypothetical protein